MELKTYPNAHRYYMQNNTFCDEAFTAYSFTSEETGEEIYFRADEVKCVSKNKTDKYIYKLSDPGKCYGYNEIWYAEPSRELAIRELEQRMEKEIDELRLRISEIRNKIYILEYNLDIFGEELVIA